MAWARHGCSMASVNQTRPHCVNKMGKTQSKPLVARHGRGTAGARHGCSMASVNQTRPHCVNQMGKTQSKPIAIRHGRGMAWARHGCGMASVNWPFPCPCSFGPSAAKLPVCHTVTLAFGNSALIQTGS